MYYSLDGGSPEKEEMRLSEIIFKIERLDKALRERIEEVQMRSQLDDERKSLEDLLEGYSQWLTTTDSPNIDVCSVSTDYPLYSE